MAYLLTVSKDLLAAFSDKKKGNIMRLLSVLYVQ